LNNHIVIFRKLVALKFEHSGNSPGSLEKAQIVGLACISNNFPGDADAAGVQGQFENYCSRELCPSSSNPQALRL
jgi:hypothetical protein